jgi:hypothetical protein
VLNININPLFQTRVCHFLLLNCWLDTGGG